MMVFRAKRTKNVKLLFEQLALISKFLLKLFSEKLVRVLASYGGGW